MPDNIARYKNYKSALGKKRTQKGNEIVFDRGNYGIAVDVYL